MYTPLESTSLQALKINTPSFDGTETSFLATSTFVYTLFFVAIVTAAFYRYVVAGALRMQASEFSIRQSNQIIKQVTLGLLGVFSLFLLLFTVNKGLVSGDISLGGLRSQPAIQTDPGLTQPQAANPPSPAAGAPTGGGSGADAITNDPVIRSQLASMGIGVNKPVCATPSSTGCTTVGGIPPSTMQALQSLKNDCGGVIVITGGNENGHKSHGPGKTPVDLRIGDPTLDNCISSFSKGVSLNYCHRTFIKYGYTFCDEKSSDRHWHIFKN